VVRVGDGAAERVAVRLGLADGLPDGVCAVLAEGEPAVVVAPVAPSVGVPLPASGEGTSLPEPFGAGPSACVPVAPLSP
jgi:hypothetical protein